MDIEDLTLNSLHKTLAFQAEDKVVACSPLSSDITEVYSVAVPRERVGQFFKIYLFIYRSV